MENNFKNIMYVYIHLAVVDLKYCKSTMFQ